MDKTTSGLEVGKKPPGNSSKPIVLYSKLYPQVRFGTTGGLYTIKIQLCVTNKTTSGFNVRKNNHQVIHQNQWCFIPDDIHKLFWVPQVDFTQFKSNPTLWINNQWS